MTSKVLYLQFEMCEVRSDNFCELYDDIVRNLKNAVFVSIDTEFNDDPSCDSHSLFDSTHIRYKKQRNKISSMVPVQIGITAFTFERDQNSYFGSTYTFYIYPPSFSYINRTFRCGSSSLKFLSEHDFDFNKWVKYGIPYLTKDEEVSLRSNFENNFMYNQLNATLNLASIEKIKKVSAALVQWLYASKAEEKIYKLSKDAISQSKELNYYLHKTIRQKFKYTLWTFETDSEIIVQKVDKSEYETLKATDKLEESLIQDLVGFSKIFRVLTDLKVPLIGHNLLTDLMLLINSFECPLPASYLSFKRIVNELFPAVYDTKCMSFDIKLDIPMEKRSNLDSLENVYEYFKNGHGRHLALNSPIIEPTKGLVSNKQYVNNDCFHNAGWDSFCTGYCFIRVAHYYTAKKYGEKCVRNFVSSELLHSVEKWKNLVNITRGSLSHLKLDGADPVTKRPPLLLVQPVKSTTVTLPEVLGMLKPLGYIEVIPNNSFLKTNSYLVAVDNYGSMKRILNKFNGKQQNSVLQITQFNYMKHSPMIRAVLWGSLVMSGGLLVYVTHSVLFKT